MLRAEAANSLSFWLVPFTEQFISFQVAWPLSGSSNGGKTQTATCSCSTQLHGAVVAHDFKEFERLFENSCLQLLHLGNGPDADLYLVTCDRTRRDGLELGKLGLGIRKRGNRAQGDLDNALGDTV